MISSNRHWDEIYPVYDPRRARFRNSNTAQIEN
jgi:hypothetical protein